MILNIIRIRERCSIAVLVALFVCSLNVRAQQVIDATTPITSHKITLQTATHYALLAGIAGARAADWASTSQAMSEPGFTEAELPQAVARFKAGLATFEIGATVVETYLSQRLSRLIRSSPY